MITTGRTRTAVALAVVTMLILVAAAGHATAAAPASCGFPYDATDATDTNVTVVEEPDRIVSLGASASQTLWEIGAEDDVVGMTPYGDYLAGADDVPTVQSGFTFQTDEIVNLSPDIVLAPNIVFQPTVDQLRAANLTVYKFPAAADIEDVEQKTQRIGRLTGHCYGARRTNAWMTRSIEAVEERIAGTDRPRVFYHLIGDVTAGSSTFVHDAIVTARGENVAAEAGITFYAEYSDDVLIQHDPEWILTAESTPVPDRPAFAATTAVESGQTLDIRDRYVSQPAPRVVYAVRRMARAFHPDAFARSDQAARTNVTARNRSAAETTRYANATSGNVTVDLEGARHAEVDVEILSDPGDGAPGTTVGSWRLTPTETARNRSATVTFSVPRARLDAVGATVDELAAFRRRGGDWTRLRRIGANATGDGAALTVRTPGFSVFTVAAVSTPRASFPAPDDAVVTGRSVTFRADRSEPIHGRIVSYEWTAGDASSTGPSFTTTFQEPGRHEVALTVRTAANLTDTATATVDVTSPASVENESDGDDAEDRGLPGFGAIVAALGVLAVAVTRIGDR